MEDLNRENGYVFGVLNKWFSELESSNEWECDLDCWEYSLEDLIRKLLSLIMAARMRSISIMDMI